VGRGRGQGGAGPLWRRGGRAHARQRRQEGQDLPRAVGVPVATAGREDAAVRARAAVRAGHASGAPVDVGKVPNGAVGGPTAGPGW
jgi:hypothetical protein